MKKADFIGILYILKNVLPVLSTLSKVFQKGTIVFARITPMITASKNSLQRLVEDESPIEEFKRETSTGNLACLELSKDEIQNTGTKMPALCSKYVSALSDNINNRFQHSLPVVASFRIFHPVSIPSEFEIYGKQDIKTLANHFFKGEENNAKCLKLEAEWNNFKYELADWSKDYQAIPSSTTITSTEWVLQRFLKQKATYSRSYPLLLQVAEVCLSMPVSNVWPERGASALKRLKTCLRNSLKKEMLESLLHITINGPPVQSSEHFISKAVALWKNTKKRRKLPLPSQLQQKERLLPPNLEHEEQEMDEIRPLNLGKEEEMEEDLEQGQEEEVSNLERDQEEQIGEMELAKELDLLNSSDDSALSLIWKTTCNFL